MQDFADQNHDIFSWCMMYDCNKISNTKESDFYTKESDFYTKESDFYTKEADFYTKESDFLNWVCWPLFSPNQYRWSVPTFRFDVEPT